MSFVRTAPLTLTLTLFAACAAQPPPVANFTPCQRVSIEPAPLWTASAAWTPAEDRLLLIGPDSRSILVYKLDGRLERRVELDPLAELDYASPVRLEATGDGYLVGDKRQILWLDTSFGKRRLWKPFEHLEDAGVAGGSLSDFTTVAGTVFAFADFVRESAAPPRAPEGTRETDPYAHQVPGADEPPEGEWFRGFVRIDLDEPEIVTLHQFALEDDEANAYYFYDRRPYLMDLGKRAYVLRYSDPPRVLSASAKSRRLRPFFSVEAADGLDVSALYAWNGRLYLLASRREEPEGAADEPTEPKLLSDNRARARLLSMGRRLAAPKQRLLFEIDPKTGRVLGRFRLPTEAAQVKLLPGRSYWALIEESSAPNMDDEDETRLLLLPSSWLSSRRGRGEAAEVALRCPEIP